MPRSTVARTGRNATRAEAVGRLVRTGVIGAFAVSTIVGLVVMSRADLLADYDPAWLIPFGAFALVGGVIVGKQPRNAMGWLFAAIGLLPSISLSLEVIGRYLRATGAPWPAVDVVTAWFGGGWYWLATIVLLLVFVPLLFPDGRLLSRRWAMVAAAGVGVLTATFLMAGAAEYLADGVRNPIGVHGVPTFDDNPFVGPLLIVAIGCAGLGIISMIIRYRRSVGVRRAQMKWVVYAAGLLLVVNVLPADAWLPEPIAPVIYPVVASTIPVAAGIAILRYRLYEIDRLVSRTVSYATITLVLVGIYAGGVVGLGWVARSLVLGTAGGELIVAASTLAVAAAFGPVRRRVQQVVDRRFNRARYDGQRIIEAFGQRLRDEVDLATLSADLRQVVRESVRPRVVGLWLPEEAPR